MDLETNAITCSEQCKASLGFAPNSVLTYERLFEFVHSGDRETAQEALCTAIAAGADYMPNIALSISAGGCAGLP